MDSTGKITAGQQVSRFLAHPVVAGLICVALPVLSAGLADTYYAVQEQGREITRLRQEVDDLNLLNAEVATINGQLSALFLKIGG